MATRPTDRRPTLTLKGDEFSPEFRSLLNKAAKKAGKTQAAFASEVLSAAARRLLAGTPDDTPGDTPQPPAVLSQLEDTNKRLDALTAQVQALTEQQRKSLWARFWGR